MLRLILDALVAIGKAYLGLFADIGVALVALWRKLTREEVADPKPPGDTTKQAYSTAVHEAGHLIAAWYCTEVGFVEFVTIVPDRFRLGHMGYRINNKHPWAHHCKAVISIAGTTAELLAFGKFRSGPCQQDLANARIKAKGPWPWKTTADGSLPFERIFKVPPTPEEHTMLVQAYRMSKQLLTHYRKEHQLVVNALLKKPTLDTQDLEALLGKRGGFVWHFWMLFDRGFILPQAKKAA